MHGGKVNTYLLGCTIGGIGCPETSVRNYHSTLRNILEERGSYTI
jgi:hypothetical protein